MYMRTFFVDVDMFYKSAHHCLYQICTWRFFIVAQRSSRCPYTLLLIELPTPVSQFSGHSNERK
jgi:hypothetical protein